MTWSINRFLVYFIAFNASILTWIFRSSTDPFITTMQLTLPLLVWELILFASFAPDDLLNLFLPPVNHPIAYHTVRSPINQPPGPHGDGWSDERTEFNQAEDLSELAHSSDSSDSDLGL
ncbi:hypothetical protein PENTCL1PPCAC_26686, partial [Pristionchus entomophagus]